MVQQTSASESRACSLLYGKGDNKQATMITENRKKEIQVNI